MNELLEGKVTKVLDNFAVEFTVEGLVEVGKAIPMYTDIEPEIDMPILLIQGDDLLNSIYFYMVLRYNKSVLYKALGNYMQYTNKGIELSSVSEILIKSTNQTLLKGKGVGINGLSGKIMIKNSESDLRDILKELVNFLKTIPKNLVAAGSPVTLLPQGITKVNSIITLINNLLGDINVDENENGGNYFMDSDQNSSENGVVVDIESLDPNSPLYDGPSLPVVVLSVNDSIRELVGLMKGTYPPTLIASTFPVAITANTAPVFTNYLNQLTNDDNDLQSIINYQPE